MSEPPLGALKGGVQYTYVINWCYTNEPREELNSKKFRCYGVG